MISSLLEQGSDEMNSSMTGKSCFKISKTRQIKCRVLSKEFH